MRWTAGGAVDEPVKRWALGAFELEDPGQGGRSGGKRIERPLSEQTISDPAFH